MAPSAEWTTDFFGPKLLTKPQTTGIPTASAFEGKKLIVLYFSASWCPPCRSFTPKLIEFYKNCKEDIGCVFVSSDRDEKSFSEYFGKMPWHAMFPSYTSTVNRNRQGRLSDIFKIQGIPSVIVLDAKTGHFITDNARTEVMSAGSDASAQKELVQSWLSKEAVPIHQASFGSGGGGSDNLIVRAIKYILTKPTYMLGIYVIVKKILRYLEEMGEDGGIEDGKEL
eukprot:CAMPEP_0196137574 /NCGR_PEP_ID=MMETSP0910-20130528/5512_1 /TAXON_ID=49265 /ORGANISM="Thalassiosira rotula, Strain GSO102" /LENGTH=224 /DNA_ID=CAMNT_0041398053 /DNA_START=195 /DNA_END=869 /DNA_ORIENTATION=-